MQLNMIFLLPLCATTVITIFCSTEYYFSPGPNSGRHLFPTNPC